MKFKNIYNKGFEPMESVYIEIYPNKEEAENIDRILRTLVNLYNDLLRKAKDRGQDKLIDADYFELVRGLNEGRKERRELDGIHTKLIENVAMRVCLVFDKGVGERRNKTCNLSLKGKRDGEYLSFTYNQINKAHENNFFENEIRLPMIGSIKANLDKETLKKIGAIRYLSVVHITSCLRKRGYFVAIDFLSDDLKRENTLNEGKINNQERGNYIYLSNYITGRNYFFSFKEKSIGRTDFGMLLIILLITPALIIMISPRRPR